MESALPGTYRSKFTLTGAERDGAQSFTDNTTFTFNVNVPERIKISGLDSITLTSSNVYAERLTSTPMHFCVFSQGGSQFQLKAQGANNPSTYSLKQGSSSISYELQLNHRSNTNNIVSLPPGNYTGAWNGSISQSCESEGGRNMSLTVHVPAGQSTNAGVYSDSVTLTVMAI
ncbi:hypothetical protein [Endozoicomonas ascidiicola]|uniref:hypothetical protein n=1 Tax=Endozoicomonas ascidiicola TaxID=1698521 RepID=UPI00083213F0|nr:hypothetical protein [Endozoicomonas ascidiicola]